MKEKRKTTRLKSAGHLVLYELMILTTFTGVL